MRLPKFRLFDYNTPGPGVDKNAPPKKGIALFGDILSRRFWKMVTLNLIYFFFSIPVLIIEYFLFYALLTFVFSDYMLDNPKMAATVSSMASYISVFVLSLFGGGAATAGMVRIIQKYVDDTHSWVWSDFIAGCKTHFFKASAVFVIDTLLLFLMGINFWFYGMMAGENIAAYLLQGLMAVIFLIFLLMHAYVYPILVSYKDKSVFEIYKTSFILAVGKLGQSAAAVGLCALISGLICFAACFYAIYFMLIIPVILFTFVTFTDIFIINPVMTKYLGKKS